MPKMTDNVLVWASDLEAATLEQAAKTARMPFVQGHVALMPDAHIGIGATVGSVIATSGAIVPAAVGVDIGCGMIAVDTGITSAALPDDLGPLHDLIRVAVPAGVGKGHQDRRPRPGLKHWPWDRQPATELTDKQQHTASDQFGTLGAGNHFVEVCLDERDQVWVVLHSGSRGIGNQLATAHIDGARKLMARYFIDLEDRDLAYFAEGTPEFDAYIRDMLWAQDYTMGNREHDDGRGADGPGRLPGPRAPGGRPGELPPQLHGAREPPGQERVADPQGRDPGAHRRPRGHPGLDGHALVHRERPGQPGQLHVVLPRRRPAPVPRRGPPHPHGGVAREQMAGKTWNDGDAEALLDEHPDSYKDIDQVMADQADLVTIKHTLHQILNYKGL